MDGWQATARAMQPLPSALLSRHGCASILKRSYATKPHYVTTPIFYVNANPHIGHLHSMLLADVFHRWAKFQGKESIFSTGTDEHGLKIQRVAEAANEPPLQLCDRVSQNFKNLARAANIDYTSFVRTTQPDHAKAVCHVWKLLKSKGLIYKGNYKGWYSVSDEAWYSDSQVSRVENGVIAIETGASVVWSEEENWMFRLSQFRERITSWLTNNKNVIHPARKQKELLDELNKGQIADLSISRPKSRLTWGISVPDDPDSTIYVWFDALINYLTVLNYPTATASEPVPRGWPVDVHIVGKDILKFHAIYWPAILLACDLPLPKNIIAHGHWKMNHYKMSKSRGNVVDPIQLLDVYGSDALRYYLLKVGGSLSRDVNYVPEQLGALYNNHLGGGYGNLFARATAPKVVAKLDAPDQLFSRPSVSNRELELETLLASTCERMDKAMTAYRVSDALDILMDRLLAASKHMGKMKPWSPDASPEQIHSALFYAMETLRIVSYFYRIFLPNAGTRVLSQLDLHDMSQDALQIGSVEGKATLRLDGRGVLFPKIKLPTHVDATTS